MYFDDRVHAAKQLVQALEHYRNKPDTLVIGIPRGGVVLAAIVAEELGLPLDVTCPRKIGAPSNPEFAIGAITETGEGYFNDRVIAQLYVSEEEIQRIVEAQKAEAKHRLDLFRKGLPPREVKGKTVILVDDGLATGSTMKAAIVSMRAEKAKNIVVAIPVSPPDTLRELETIADEVICLEAPSGFMAVGQFYRDFGEVFDEEVVDLMQGRQ